MRAAAELFGEVAHFDEPHDGAVFFPEEREGVFGNFAEGHFSPPDGGVFENLFVCEVFNLAELVGSRSLVVREVEAQPFGIHVGARLPYVRAEHLAHCPVEYVGRGVVPLYRAAAHNVDSGGNFGAYGILFEHPLADFVEHVAGVVHFGVENFARGSVYLYEAGIADLPALFGVKRRLRHYHEVRVGALDYRAYGGREVGEVRVVVAGELRGMLDLRGVGDADDFPRLGVARPLALLVHLGLEALFVNGHVALARDELREVEREAVGIVENEGLVARDAALGHSDVVEQLQAPVECAGKALFLVFYDFKYDFPLLFELGEYGRHLLYDGLGELCEKPVFQPEPLAVHHRPGAVCAAGHSCGPRCPE